MGKIEIGKPIPEDFFIPDLKSKITGECSEEVCTLVRERLKHTLSIGKKTFEVGEINTHGDLYLSSPQQHLFIGLAQCEEISLFMYLIKFALEIGEIENILHPEKGNLIGLIRSFGFSTDRQNRDSAGKVVEYGNFNEFSSNKDYHTIRKFPHYKIDFYILHIDRENETLVIRDKGILGEPYLSKPYLPGLGFGEFRIYKTDIIHILRCLISCNGQYGGRMNPGRYEDAIKFIFSDEFQEEFGRYMC